MKKVELSKPITAHGQQVSELELAEPQTADVMELGYPYLVIPSEEGDTGIEVRPKVIGRYIMRLAKIPKSSVEQLDLSDFQKLQGVVMDFFGT